MNNIPIPPPLPRTRTSPRTNLPVSLATTTDTTTLLNDNKPWYKKRLLWIIVSGLSALAGGGLNLYRLSQKDLNQEERRNIVIQSIIIFLVLGLGILLGSKFLLKW